jgi:EAL domain-containing protein (putative c-di-GMP-specific phosphodiesterase class I)
VAWLFPAQVALALERADLGAEPARRASVDPLTGLANRAAFSRRLRGWLQPDDLAARLGGDEFAVLVPEVADKATAIALGERLAAILPVVELADGRLAGLEALVRWDHPERGMVMPGEFVSLAEDTGLIVPIGRWVLHAACQAARDWQRRFPLQPHPFLSVNLSVRQLQQPDLLEDVADALEASGLDPGELMLEITESVLATDQKAMLERLGGLRALGVHLAIDDFGTGYSSLAYLRHLPVNLLKLAKPFVDGLLRGAGEAALTGPSCASPTSSASR